MPRSHDTGRASSCCAVSAAPRTAAALCLLVSSCILAANSVEGFAPTPKRGGGSSLLMATWSDSKAVKDYQEFLQSGLQEVELKSDMGSVIVIPEDDDGNNPAAAAIFSMGMGTDRAVRPSELLPEEMDGSSEYPIYIALPPAQIEPFIRDLSEDFSARNQDFVFISGGPNHGNIEDVLKSFGYCRDSMTQLLMSGLEINPSGVITDKSVNLGPDAAGETKWAGSCAVCGKWRGAVAERLMRSNVRCQVDFYREWRRRMWEQTLLDAIFPLVGVVREQDTTISDVAKYYEQEVSDMIWETSGCLRGWKAVTLPYGVEERIFAVAEAATEKPCVLSDYMYDFIWGNRVFTEGKMFLEYLWFAREQFGLLQDVELPPKRTSGDDAESGIMRTGNLRADGVI